MTMFDEKCDVCGIHPPIGVASSPFAAYSLAYCVKCLHKRAEQEGIFEYLYCDVAHGDPSKLRSEIKDYFTFKNGEYISWDDWVRDYGSKIDLVARDKEFEEYMKIAESVNLNE